MLLILLSGLEPHLTRMSARPPAHLMPLAAAPSAAPPVDAGSQLAAAASAVPAVHVDAVNAALTVGHAGGKPHEQHGAQKRPGPPRVCLHTCFAATSSWAVASRSASARPAAAASPAHRSCSAFSWACSCALRCCSASDGSSLPILGLGDACRWWLYSRTGCGCCCC
jgi:hypothetical protein